MEQVISLEDGDAVLFKLDSCHGQKLKQFMLFLKERYHAPVSFAHTPAELTYQRKLTASELIQLEAIPTRIQSSDKNSIWKFAEEKQNPYLLQMLHSLGDLDREAIMLSPKEIRMLSLSINLLRDSKVMMIENPEELLSTDELAMLQNAMQLELQKNRILLISTRNETFWLNIITKIVTKNVNKRFAIFKNHSPVAVLESVERFLKSA